MSSKREASRRFQRLDALRFQKCRNKLTSYYDILYHMGETDTLYYDIEKDRSAMLSTSFPSSDYREEIAHIETLAATWRRQRRLIASPEALRS